MIENTDDLPSLPNSWAWTRLEEIGIVASGGTPSTSVPEYFDGDVPWITPADLSSFTGKLIQRGRRNISEKGLHSSSAVLLPAGTILFSSRAPIGYVAIAANPTATNQGFKNLTLHEGVFNEYVFHYLKASKKLAESYGSGTTFREVSASRFRLIPIPLAPYNEQVRIVARLEELFARLRAGVEGLRKVRAQLKRYRQAVLKHAFEGKLTEEWRKIHRDRIEPAQALLRKIMEERIRRGIGQWKNADAVDVKGLPEIPDGWIWVRAQEVCENITNGYTPPASELHSLKGEIPFIKVNNLTFTGKLDFSKNMAFIDKKLHETMLKRSKILPGDVLINIVGPPLGKVSIVPNLYPEWNINQAIVFFRPIEGYNRDFLALCLQTNTITSHLTDQAKATAGQFNISVNMSRNSPVPLPPREEQDKIVSEVKKRFDATERVEATINESMSKADYLRNSVLKAAFIGQLVPQDPNDEPAEKLLERIKAERAKSKGEKDTNKGRKNKPKQSELPNHVK